MRMAMKSFLWVALAIMAMPSNASADISWAAGAPGGTSGGSASFDQSAGGQITLLSLIHI